jgi:[ribosomal protein S5]-alanine N-acetyltransferase
MTEAARRVIAHGCERLRLMLHNPGSWRVMEKAGMRREGLLRGYFKRGEQFKDIVWYAVLRGEWEAARDAGHRGDRP